MKSIESYELAAVNSRSRSALTWQTIQIPFRYFSFNLYVLLSPGPFFIRPFCRRAILPPGLFVIGPFCRGPSAEALLLQAFFDRPLCCRTIDLIITWHYKLEVGYLITSLFHYRERKLLSSWNFLHLPLLTLFGCFCYLSRSTPSFCFPSHPKNHTSKSSNFIPRFEHWEPKSLNKGTTPQISACNPNPSFSVVNKFSESDDIYLTLTLTGHKIVVTKIKKSNKIT
jgi:hypothetical protein